MEGTAISSQSFTGSKGTIHYLSGGPETGPLIIFVHGCPFPAITWRPQLQCFASLGFRVVAADTTGYGDSYNSADVADYSMESQVSDQLELLSHVGREKAVFIGHDWGSAIVWSIAAHHQDKCLGVAALGIPYRTVELGLEKLVATVDRNLYPEDEYPYGQWDYMVYYNQNTKDIEAYHAEHGDRLAKLFTMPYDGPIPPVQTPGVTASVTKSGGFFGGQARRMCRWKPRSWTPPCTRQSSPVRESMAPLVRSLTIATMQQMQHITMQRTAPMAPSSMFRVSIWIVARTCVP
ncbi:hypothetical protein NQ176_g3426 [Zarea fungicola]|uniref:Uncharacterized protein n=1 Tax=Zarea fungicola TaxID=93591 RepID=A0ACC1NL47_9HYPO|nr:hypothetical protein NQ176_g3426 [Lecanicillium fungicola]